MGKNRARLTSSSPHALARQLLVSLGRSYPLVGDQTRGKAMVGVRVEVEIMG